ncbi:hypothetical protein TNCV_678691 [Trichonephila clavipes]|nr:hypothetical protein TNCV_678691 [Trichonephila clavipes]
MDFKLGNESYFPSRSDSNAVPPQMSLSVPGLGLNKREEKKKAMNKSSSEMYSTGHPAWALLHPIYIRQASLEAQAKPVFRHS